MRRILLVGLLAACGGGLSVTSGAQTFASSRAGSLPSDGTQCGDLAVEYHSAFIEAVACDAAAPDACTEWRPLTVGSVGNGGSTADAKLTGLCFVAGFGYVTPKHSAPLDEIIARYRAAGCTVGYCPSPSPRPVRCEQNAAGRFTCGGG
ncbi:MAG: hypothetical protein ACXWLM_07020 [Myxococcales bacterium]